MSAIRYKHECPECGSNEVFVDAHAWLNPETGGYELAGDPMNFAMCNDCGRESKNGAYDWKVKIPDEIHYGVSFDRRKEAFTVLEMNHTTGQETTVADFYMHAHEDAAGLAKTAAAYLNGTISIQELNE